MTAAQVFSLGESSELLRGGGWCPAPGLPRPGVAMVAVTVVVASDCLDIGRSLLLPRSLANLSVLADPGTIASRRGHSLGSWSRSFIIFWRGRSYFLGLSV